MNQKSLAIWFAVQDHCQRIYGVDWNTNDADDGDDDGVDVGDVEILDDDENDGQGDVL